MNIIVKQILIGVLIVVGLGVTLFGLRYFGVIGERIILENSFQYQEARKSAMTTYEAQLTEIEIQLRRGDLSNATRSNLDAQRSALRIRLNAERSKQK